MATPNKRLLRVMVDTNVLVAGTVWPRWPYAVIEHAIKRDFQLVLCSEVISEAERRIKRRFPDYFGQFQQLLADSGYELTVDPDPIDVAVNNILLRDQTDVSIALAAIGAQVDCFVTSDKDFTDPSNVDLRRQLKVVLPAVFLRDIMGWSSDALEAIRGREW